MNASKLEHLAKRTREAQRTLGTASSSSRTGALEALENLLSMREATILEANARDVARADTDGLAGPLRSRLVLTSAKLQTLKEGIRSLAAQPDPVGKARSRTQLDDELELSEVSSPIGVLLIIFESRPDAVIQIGSLAIRSGNGVILKGGREARETNACLVALLREALEVVGLDPESVQGIEDRGSVAELLALDHDIDLVIPRGSGELVRTIQESTRIPVLGHAEGVCTLYLDAEADPDMAANLAVDGKCDYPAACNATETLLVHKDFLPKLGRVGKALLEAGVTLRADSECLPYLTEAETAGPEDGATEYGDLILAVRCVNSLEAAVSFIHTHGSGHTESIVTQNRETARTFLRVVDSASVFHNCSTRFADGFRYGLGAEVGISTGRIHARGPVGVEGLMTTRWLLEGNGQIAASYGPGKRAFIHKKRDL